MFSFFRQTFRQWARSGTNAASASVKKPTRTLQCEALEDRVMPSVMGSEILVNSNKTGKQFQAAGATSSNGSSVVVWTELKGTVNGDIKAQRFDSSGNKVGGEILVAGGYNPQHSAVVDMDANGNFTVAWVHDFSTTDRDIRAARFSSSGAKIGGELIVANSPKNEYDPSIAVAGNGDFVVSYTYQFSGSDTDIKATLFNANGSVKKKFDVDVSSRAESQSAADMAGDGRFAITYVKSDDIIVKRYNKDGGSLGTNTIANSTRVEREPSVALDNSGNALVVWQDNVNNNWNVLGRSVSSGGSVGSTFNVATTSAQETLPSIAIDPTNGKFVVAYQAQTTGNPNAMVAEMTASRTLIRTSTALTNVADPFVSLGGGAHRFLALGNSTISKGGDYDGGIFARWGIL